MIFFKLSFLCISVTQQPYKEEQARRNDVIRRSRDVIIELGSVLVGSPSPFRLAIHGNQIVKMNEKSEQGCKCSHSYRAIT